MGLSQARTGALVAQAKRGDPAAFEALVRAYMRAAYAVALSLVGRPADAEDVAQEALLAAFEHLESCQQPERFGGWLLQIVRNHGRNWLTRRKLRDVPGEDRASEAGGSPGEQEGLGLQEQLLGALRALSLVQQEVVLLHDLEGWTHAEIAMALEMTEVTSRQHLFKARRELRSRLDEQGGGGES